MIPGCSGRVGPLALADLDTGLLRQGRSAELILQLLHSRYFEQDIRSGIFTAVTPPAITKIGASWPGSQAGTTNTSLPMNAQAVNVGDFVIIGAMARAATAPTGLAPTSSLGNAFTQLATLPEAQTIPTLSVLYAGFITVAGTDTITWNWVNAGCCSASGTRWANVGGANPAAALDVAIIPAGTTVGSNIAATSNATLTPYDLGIAFTAVGGPATLTITQQAFTPGGAPVAVPDSIVQSTGANATTCQFSEVLIGPAGTTATFSALSSVTNAWTCFLACFKPTAVSGGRLTTLGAAALFGLSNPLGSGKNLSVIRVEMVVKTLPVTPVIGYYGLYVSAIPDSPAVTGAVIAPIGGVLGGTNVAATGQGLIGMGLPATPQLFRLLGQKTATGEAPLSPPPPIALEFDGTCILTPGTALSIQQDAADATNASVVAAITWEEALV